MADDAAENGAADGAGDLAAAAADIAARDAAEDGATGRAGAGIARIDVHLAHGLDDAETHRLLAHHLVAAVVAGTGVVGASAREQRTSRGDRGNLGIPHFVLLSRVSRRSSRRIAPRSRPARGCGSGRPDVQS